MILYAGEILSMHESHIIKYKLFETRKDALAAYDKNRYRNVDFYSDDRCKMGFFLWGYFAVRRIEI